MRQWQCSAMLRRLRETAAQMESMTGLWVYVIKLIDSCLSCMARVKVREGTTLLGSGRAQFVALRLSDVRN